MAKSWEEWKKSRQTNTQNAARETAAASAPAATSWQAYRNQKLGITEPEPVKPVEQPAAPAARTTPEPTGTVVRQRIFDARTRSISAPESKRAGEREASVAAQNEKRRANLKTGISLVSPDRVGPLRENERAAEADTAGFLTNFQDYLAEQKEAEKHFTVQSREPEEQKQTAKKPTQEDLDALEGRANRLRGQMRPYDISGHASMSADEYERAQEAMAKEVKPQTRSKRVGAGQSAVQLPEEFQEPDYSYQMEGNIWDSFGDDFIEWQREDAAKRERAQLDQAFVDQIETMPEYDEYARQGSLSPWNRLGRISTSGSDSLEDRAFETYAPDDVKKKYLAILGSRGVNQAEKYISDMQEQWNAQMAQEEMRRIENAPAALRGIMEASTAIGSGLTQTFGGYGVALGHVLGIQGKQPVAVTSFVSQELKKKLDDESGWKLFGKEGWGWKKILYETLETSSAQIPQMITGLGGGGSIATLGPMAVSVWGNTYNQAMHDGYTENEATNLAAWSAAIEVATEKIGGVGFLSGGTWTEDMLGDWINHWDNAFARYAMNMGSNFLGEFSEEAVSGILDPYVDAFVRWESMSDEERAKVHVDWDEVLYEAMLGGISGIAMGGPTTTAQFANEYQQQNEAYEMGKGGLTNEQFRESFAEANEDGAQDWAVQAYQKGMVEFFRRMGESGRSIESLEAEYGTLNDEQRAAFEQGKKTGMSAEKTHQLLEELDVTVTTDQQTMEDAQAAQEASAAENAPYDTGERLQTRDEAEPAATEPEETQEARQPYDTGERLQTREEEETTQEQPQEQETERQPYDDGERLQTREEPEKEIVRQAAEIAAETVGNEEISREQKVATVREALTAAGETMNVYEKAEAIVALAGNEQMSGEQQREVSSSDTAMEFARAVAENRTPDRTAYEYGRSGLGLENLEATGAEITDEVRAQFEQGRADARKESAARAAARNAQGAEPGRVGTVTTISQAEAQAHGVRTIDTKKLSPKQRAAKGALQALGKATGVNFVLYESNVNDNFERVGSNGWYDDNTRTAYIDIESGRNGEQAMLRTTAHELTHFIENNSDQYDQLRDYLIGYYNQQGPDVLNSMVADEIETARSQGREIGETEAIHEVVANGMEMMLSDPEAIRTLARENTSLFARIRMWLDDFVHRITAAFQGVESDEEASKVLWRSTEAVREARDLWYSALSDAADNVAGTENVNEQIRQEIERIDEAKYQELRKLATGKAGLTDRASVMLRSTDRNVIDPQKRVLDALGKKYGFEIVLVDSLEGRYNGTYLGGRTVFVAKDAAEGALVQTGMHEAVHMVRALNDGGYQTLMETVRASLGEEFDWDGRVREVMETRHMTEDEAIEEIVADTVPAIMTSPMAMRDLMEKEIGVFKKVRRYFNEFFTALKNLTQRFAKSQGSRELEAILKAGDEQLQAIKAAFDAAAYEMDPAAMPEMMKTAKFSRAMEPTRQRRIAMESDVDVEQWRKGNQYVQDLIAMTTLGDLAGVMANGGRVLTKQQMETQVNIMSPIRGNVEYIYSFDVDTNCPKTLRFDQLMARLAKMKGGNLTEVEARNLINLMREMGDMLPCAYCYLNNKRIQKAAAHDFYVDAYEKVMSLPEDQQERAIFRLWGREKEMGKPDRNKKGGLTPAGTVRNVLNNWRSMQQQFTPLEGQTAIRSMHNAMGTILSTTFEALDQAFPDGGIYEETDDGRLFNAPRRADMFQTVVDALGLTADQVAEKTDGRKLVETFIDAWLDDKIGILPHDEMIPAEDRCDLAYIRDNFAAITGLHALANNYAASNSQAKNVEQYMPYWGQVWNTNLQDKGNINARGGFRFQSSSDFTAKFAMEYIQFFSDLAADKRGGDWLSHGYTKSRDFVEIFWPTRAAINVSVAYDGDRRSGIMNNTQEGIDQEWVREFLRKNKKATNVGVMAMVTNNDQLALALTDPNVHMIIPFHASGLAKEYFYNVQQWQNYQGVQGEQYYTQKALAEDIFRAAQEKGEKITKKEAQARARGAIRGRVLYEKSGTGYKKKAPHFLPGEQNGVYYEKTADGEYVPVTLPGFGNDAQRYLELCREYGVKPRFAGVEVPVIEAKYDAEGNIASYEFTDRTIPVTQHENYLKLIKEAARAEEQKPVVAEFDLNALKRLLEAESKGETAMDPLMGEYVSAALGNYSYGQKILGETRRLLTEEQYAARLRNAHPDYSEERILEMVEKGEELDRDNYFLVRDLYQRQIDDSQGTLTWAELRGGRNLRVKWEREKAEREAKRLQYSERKEGFKSDRQLLAEALESVAVNETERGALRRYQANAERINQLNDQLDEVQDQIRAQSADENADRNTLAALRTRARALENTIAREDKALLRLENGEVLRRILEVEKRNAAERATQNAERRLQRYKERTRERVNDQVSRRVESIQRQANERVARAQARADERVQRVQEKADERVNRTMAKAKEIIERKVETDAVTKLKADIAQRVSRMKKELLNPDPKKGIFVPETAQNAIAQLIKAVDFSSKRKLAGGAPTQADLRLAQGLEALERVLQRTSDQQDQTSEQLVNDSFGGYVDLPESFLSELRDLTEQVRKATDAAISAGGFTVNEMNSQQLEALKQILDIVHHVLGNMNKTMTQGLNQNITQIGADMIWDAKQMTKRKGVHKFLKQFEFDHITPIYFFKRLGKGGAQIWEAMRTGQKVLADRVEEVEKFFDSHVTEDELKKWRETIHEFELKDGTKVAMPTTYVMEMYNHSKREQAMGHYLGAGFRVADFKRNGKTVQGAESYISQEEFNKIIGSLSERQRQVADEFRVFMGETGGEWGNEVSMRRFGIKQYTEGGNYWTIQSDPAYTPTEPTTKQGQSLYRLLNMGFTKALVKGANNRIMVNDMFETWATHMADMCQYSALALPVLDAVKVLNYKEITRMRSPDGKERNVRVNSVKNALRDAHGEGSISYLTQFLRDVSGAGVTGQDEQITSRLLKLRNRGAVSANLRVAALQPTAIIRALVEMDATDLLPALVNAKRLSPKHWKTMTERFQTYSGIGKWKAMGFYDANVSRSIMDRFGSDKGAYGRTVDKVMEKAMALAEKMDNVTWSVIWEAAERKAAKLHPEMDRNSEEFFTEAARIFDDVCYKTQVADSVFTRSQYMRTNEGFHKYFGSFMMEPVLTYNVMADKIITMLDDARRTGSWQTALKQNATRITRATVVYLMAAAGTAFVEALFEAWRDDDDYETFMEKLSDAYMGNVIEDVMPFNKLPGYSQVYDGVKSILAMFNKNIYAYGSSNPISEVFEQAESMIKAWKADSKYTDYGKAYSLFKGIQTVAGLPVANLAREGVSLWNNTIAAAKPDMRVETYPTSASVGGDAFVQAYIDGEEARQTKLLTQMEANGADVAKTILNAAKTAYKDGKLDEEKAVDLLVAFGGQKTENEARLVIRKWQNQVETGNSSAGDYAKVYQLIDDWDGAALRTEIKELMSLGKEKSSIASSITNHYKAAYLAASTAEKATMKQHLIEVFKMIGYSQADAKKKIEGWK